MKNRYTTFLLVIPLLFISICCKNTKKTLVGEKNKIEDVTKDKDAQNCIIEADSIKIKAFVKEIIKEIINKNYDNLLEKMENTFEEKKNIDKMAESFPNYIESIFSLDIDNEDGETVGKIKNLQNAKIVSEKNQENCLDVSIGLDTGLYFTIKKINGKLKISKYDIAG